MKVRPSVLLYQSDSVLLMRYRYHNNDVWAIPGGNPDEGETLQQTLVRELYEELGIEIVVKDLVLVAEVQTPTGKDFTLHCIFVGSLLSGQPQLNPHQTSAIEARWLNINELKQINMYPHVAPYIEDIVKTSPRTIPIYLGKIEQKWF